MQQVQEAGWLKDHNTKAMCEETLQEKCQQLTCLHVFKGSVKLIIIQQLDCLQVVECLKIHGKLVDISLTRVMVSPRSVQ